VSKPVSSGYISVVINYGCGNDYTCHTNWHGELRVSSTTPGSVVVPVTSTALARADCESPMVTVINVFDARDGAGNVSNQLYSQSGALTLNCGSSSSTPPSATNSSFNGTWQGTFTGQESGFLEFSISGSTITLEEPEAGTGTLTLASSYANSNFVTRSDTKSCRWTGPFLPGGARQSSASGLWSCSDADGVSTSGEWLAVRTSATASPAPTPAPTTPTPTTGGSITIVSTTRIGCTEAGAGYNCRTGTIEIRNDSSSLAGKSVRLATSPSFILTPVFTMPKVNGTATLQVNSVANTSRCPSTQTAVNLVLADSSSQAGSTLATKSVSIPVSCSQ
jgi:hypothetical protein